MQFVLKTLEATFAQIIGRGINFLIPFALLHLYAPGAATDTFFFAFSIAFFFFGTVANALTDASVPRAVAGQPLLATRLRMRLGLALALIAVVAVALSGDFVGWLSVTTLLGIGAMVMGAIYASLPVGVLIARDAYASPGLLWGLRMLPLLVWWLMRPNEKALGWLMLGLGGMDLLRAHCLNRLAQHGTSPSGGGWNSLQGYFPVVVAAVVAGLNPIVDRLIATQAGNGGLSLLEAGERFYGVLATIATVGTMNVILVQLSHKRTPSAFARLWPGILGIGTLWAGGWSVLGLVGWHFMGESLTVGLLHVNAVQAHLIDEIYLYYLAGLPAFVLGLACVRAYLALGWQYLLMGFSLLSVTANAGLSLALYNRIGVPGIALATTAVYSIITLCMLAHLSRLSRATLADTHLPSHEARTALSPFVLYARGQKTERRE